MYTILILQCFYWSVCDLEKVPYVHQNVSFFALSLISIITAITSVTIFGDRAFGNLPSEHQNDDFFKFYMPYFSKQNFYFLFLIKNVIFDFLTFLDSRFLCLPIKLDNQISTVFLLYILFLFYKWHI